MDVKWKILANKLASSGVICTNTCNMKVYTKSVQGTKLLDFIVKDEIAVDREAALSLCTRLIDFDLLHHVTFEFGKADLDTSQVYTLVESDEADLVRGMRAVSHPAQAADLDTTEIYSL